MPLALMSAFLDAASLMLSLMASWLGNTATSPCARAPGEATSVPVCDGVPLGVAQSDNVPREGVEGVVGVAVRVVLAVAAGSGVTALAPLPPPPLPPLPPLLFEFLTMLFGVLLGFLVK